MTYLFAMTAATDGIEATAPAKWRSLNGAMGVFWEARCMAGARGYYVSSDPRMMIFFNDISAQFQMTNLGEGSKYDLRSMSRAIYVPAGTPMWTYASADHRFSHLDVHIHRERLLKIIAPAIGTSTARRALERPVETHDVGAIEALAALLVDEIAHPTKHPIYAESLIDSLVTAFLDIPAAQERDWKRKLSQTEVSKLLAHPIEDGELRLTVAEMAATVGLSERQFNSAFKNTTGQTPLQWQLGRRVDLAQQIMLESDTTMTDIAAKLGFTDQAHLTNVFRRIVGDTPAAWRRMHKTR
ncbi:helix-turn-helix domain-containing protein [Aliirhizobium smilacinae]|uniref:Helix-turn-helix domain-containing protein n=1 Tax=Aliirhizobium smilacinae TaxID=1395944 RepID=A0A5C4XRU2_9HYPH|nr:AraC family transcriptional regulator [Rhizobium smilacinae]TNM65270.1 helix-turn-helix domain-containing protein [Rhizobium smilacinae]